jgi:hypothetical protein
VIAGTKRLGITGIRVFAGGRRRPRARYARSLGPNRALAPRRPGGLGQAARSRARAPGSEGGAVCPEPETYRAAGA